MAHLHYPPPRHPLDPWNCRIDSEEGHDHLECPSRLLEYLVDSRLVWMVGGSLGYVLLYPSLETHELTSTPRQSRGSCLPSCATRSVSLPLDLLTTSPMSKLSTFTLERQLGQSVSPLFPTYSAATDNRAQSTGSRSCPSSATTSSRLPRPELSISVSTEFRPASLLTDTIYPAVTQALFGIFIVLIILLAEKLVIQVM